MTEQRWKPVEDGEIVLDEEIEENGFHYKLSVVVQDKNLKLIDRGYQSMSVFLPNNLRLCKLVEVEGTQPAAEVLYRVEGMVTVEGSEYGDGGWYNVDDVSEDELQDKIDDILESNVGQKISIVVERVQP